MKPTGSEMALASRDAALGPYQCVSVSQAISAVKPTHTTTKMTSVQTVERTERIFVHSARNRPTNPAWRPAAGSAGPRVGVTGVHCQTRLRGGKFRACGDRYDEARDEGGQAMSGLPRELRDLIESGPLAHLSTINADGSPQVSVIWVGLDGDDLVSGHMQWYAKLRNIERDPRVVLSFEAPRAPGVFLNPYAVLHARAAIEPGDDAWNLLDRLTKVYMSPETGFPAPKGPGYLVRYSVERIGGVGPWVP